MPNVLRPLLLVTAAFALTAGVQAANPFLPSYEYIPDGEPRVFGDRLYLYGSHDRAGSTRFCDYVLKVWSAPLTDLQNWTDHGVVFSTRHLPGRADDIDWSDNEFYAPDAIEHRGKYYLFAQIVGAPCAVAVSDHPAGPFRLLGKVKAPAGAPQDFGGWSQYFDPGVLIDDDGKIYLYWGGGRSYMAQLDPEDLTQVLPGTYQEDIIPPGAPFDFQEGCSPRKINGLYYLVYARGLDLAYATSAKPTGPFTFRGVIVNHRVDAHGGIIHGGLAELNGQWHIFYHRMTNNTVYSRRACVERVTILPDGSIPLVEQTSLGFAQSLNPYQRTTADLACVFRGGSFVTELHPRCHPVRGNRDTSVVGYKYFDFGTALPGQSTTLAVDYRPLHAGSIEVWLGDPEHSGRLLGTIAVPDETLPPDNWREASLSVPVIEGRHALYFRFKGAQPDQEIADLRAFTFTRDTY